MPSRDHEILVGLFRDNGQLAAELLRACAGIAVDHARVALESIDLTQVAPAAYYADAVAILCDHHGAPVTGVILSVMAHPELEIAEAAIGAIAPLPEDRRQLFGRHHDGAAGRDPADPGGSDAPLSCAAGSRPVRT